MADWKEPTHTSAFLDVSVVSVQDKKQREILENLPEHFFAVQKHYRLPIGDFPNIQRFREVAEV